MVYVKYQLMQRNYLRSFTKFSRANQVWKDLKDLEDPMGPKLVIYILSVLFMSVGGGGGGGGSVKKQKLSFSWQKLFQCLYCFPIACITNRNKKRVNSKPEQISVLHLVRRTIFVFQQWKRFVLGTGVLTRCDKTPFFAIFLTTYR